MNWIIEEIISEIKDNIKIKKKLIKNFELEINQFKKRGTNCEKLKILKVSHETQIKEYEYLLKLIDDMLKEDVSEYETLYRAATENKIY